MNGVRTTQRTIQKSRKGKPKINGLTRLTKGRAKTSMKKGIRAKPRAIFVPFGIRTSFPGASPIIGKTAEVLNPARRSIPKDFHFISAYVLFSSKLRGLRYSQIQNLGIASIIMS